MSVLTMTLLCSQAGQTAHYSHTAPSGHTLAAFAGHQATRQAARPCSASLLGVMPLSSAGTSAAVEGPRVLIHPPDPAGAQSVS